MHGRTAESARLVGIDAAQDENAHAGAEEGKNRSGTACFRYDVYGCESRDTGDDYAYDDLNDIRRMEFRMHFVETHRHEAVPAHRIESTALGKEHAKDDCGKATDSARTDDSRPQVQADVFEDIRSRSRRIQHRIWYDAGHGRTDGNIQDGADGQCQNDSDWHIPFRILRFFCCCR